MGSSAAAPALGPHAAARALLAATSLVVLLLLSSTSSSWRSSGAPAAALRGRGLAESLGAEEVSGASKGPGGPHSASSWSEEEVVRELWRLWMSLASHGNAPSQKEGPPQEAGRAAGHGHHGGEGQWHPPHHWNPHGGRWRPPHRSSVDDAERTHAHCASTRSPLSCCYANPWLCKWNVASEAAPEAEWEAIRMAWLDQLIGANATADANSSAVPLHQVLAAAWRGRMDSQPHHEVLNLETSARPEDFNSSAVGPALELSEDGVAAEDSADRTPAMQWLWASWLERDNSTEWLATHVPEIDESSPSAASWWRRYRRCRGRCWDNDFPHPIPGHRPGDSDSDGGGGGGVDDGNGGDGGDGDDGVDDDNDGDALGNATAAPSGISWPEPPADWPWPWPLSEAPSCAINGWLCD